MSIRLGMTIVAATVLFWPVSSLRAGEGARAGARSTIVPPGSLTPTRFADLYRQAPVGHRQPRPSDLLEPVQTLPVDTELRRLDEEIDRKLIICRHC
ncbi:hypothetical protein A5906_30970 [Bradyrhizobium sacchari]|uniref:Uncharacterized protein n=1 Tax=Bradyrhizobium sacchari TaxID=1399419 RepID=A0A560JGB1_9BRAD|nr:hypothetical protein [Bradyrhizobium sacchari]OPY98546.1 hypothetical protein A5906_30970 [Bradyrhizobium sacchari]TWB52409.1 hypothetical protein FBZ94_109131 [Bradyrhizobium sacchari]TWB70231.1 hypothetical protein FBZ95_108232 [Bradyrhizobium sacchari]